MASLLKKKLSSVSSLVLSSRHYIPRNLIPFFHFSTQTQQKDVPFIAQYLISSFGFSEDRALRVATDRNLIPIKTSDRPESVIRFLKVTGLTDDQVKAVISYTPRVLNLSVSKTLEPCSREVIAGGFTEKTFLHLIRFNPMALTYRNLLSRLQFWRNFVGNNEENLLKLLKKRMLMSLDIDKRIIPQINLFREYGLSDQEIAKLIVNMDYLLVQNPESIKLLFEQMEKLGFPRGSKMFLLGLAAFGSLKKDTFDRKVAFFETTYGWSKEDITLAIKKLPTLVKLSEENVSSTMDFLVRKVGLNPRSIALWPRLLGCSLQRRLIPRHYVLTVLKSKSKGPVNNWAFYSVAIMSEKHFIEKFILPYSKELPNLEKKYATACAGKTSVS